MSLEGFAAVKYKLRGKLSELDVILLSAYAIAVKNGFEGTEEEWLASLKGEKGDTGRGLEIADVYATLDELRAAFPAGTEYAYQVTGENGEIFVWSEKENDWVSLGVLTGADGKSAYESAQDGGYTGTDSQFYTDLAEVSNKEAAGTVAAHNTDTEAHADIRELANAAQTAANTAQTTADSKAPAYTYGTDDLEAGTTALETGKLHFVYE